MATYRHKTIQRYRIGPFEFKNHLLVINDEKAKPGESNKDFLALLADQPARSRNQIVEIDEEAYSRLERKLPNTVRGAQQSRDVRSPSKEGVRAGQTVNQDYDNSANEKQKSPNDSDGDGVDDNLQKPNPTAAAKSNLLSKSN